MSVRKIAISVPEDVLLQIDRAAAARDTTRSGFISEVLRRVARARGEAEVSRRIREFFDDPEVALEQRKAAMKLSRAASRLPDWEW